MLNSLLSFFNYEVFKTKPYVPVNTIFDAIYWSDKKTKPIFSLPTQMIVNPLGFRYSKTTEHPYILTIKQYLQKGADIDYDTSVLKKYYENFAPIDTSDLFREIKGIDDYEFLKSKKLPKAYILPWDSNWQFKEHDCGLLVDEHGRTLLGPVSKKRGIFELNRIISIYNSIKNRGYIPKRNEKFNGYFLKNGSEFTFLLESGNHRMAALTMLNYQSIEVTFTEGKPRIIDIETINDWPQVINKNISEDVAKEIFYYIFNSSLKTNL